MRLAIAIVLALTIAALVTWYRERLPQQELTSKQGEKCDYKKVISRFDPHPCWFADDPIK
jgi:hypothetical protein